MIVEGLMQAGLWILQAVLAVLDVLPPMPDLVLNAVNQYLDLILDNCGIVPFFFPMSLGIEVLSIVFVLANWKRLYHFIMWVWHKVPISSD